MNQKEYKIYVLLLVRKSPEFPKFGIGVKSAKDFWHAM